MKREKWDSRFLNAALETDRGKEMITGVNAWGGEK
jgi:hypothetical protein